MIVVADAGPLQYLARIGVIEVLAPLYQRVLVPQSVVQELQRSSTPIAVRAWIARPPVWCELRSDPPVDLTLAFLGPGERAAIPLALAVSADRLLIDDLAGRGEARRRHLNVTGTLGVLANAHVTRLLDFEQALSRLRQTNFYVSDEVIAAVRRDIASAESNV